ncbi:hypothetical protein LEP1GSC132_0647 [Leptospira kirschneri str. 200803703]|nr:hypothetical protein LEP1GSC044_0644 [Leptospira kirschneri serovar Grippotyphosa str. RM52]EKP07089.1 hypothetical protein LEP1GSC018_1022 [Leptospira kirschneri str. 2008720114]EKQ85401.1 hypothetical protein LEP1GSC064_0771 [Leptospira kirschneri serovar Grippotyphosa str. Moskva]EMK05705.1 hypothetical protein LEP1GSC176_2735 [Leptospira kirschneri str. MMD1493]EMN26649.1 hypothetical protein LEP1GSC065_2757 [Leptospira kirschneri serovar Sokoine str. RM1]EMO66142.1 hypothetical protein
MSFFLSSKENLRLVILEIFKFRFRITKESIHNFLHSKSTNSA